MRTRAFLFCLGWAFCCATPALSQSLDDDPTVAQVSEGGSLADGYDVILLVGQSNMAGRAPLVAGEADAAVHPRIFMWHPISGIVPAQDPLVHQEPRQTGTAGPGLTLAKAYLRRIPSNRKVLLVGAAYGGTSFVQDVTMATSRWNFSKQAFESVPNLHHRWIATSDLNVGGDLYRGAVRRANDAMAAAGPTARLVGIVWHQGESDAVHGGAGAYASHHRNLIAALRANITGASGSTPMVVGEFNPCFLAACPQRTGAQPTPDTFQTLLRYFHSLRQSVPYTAWVSSAGLGWMADGTHFDLASTRELGRRYADKLFEASMNLPQPEVDLKVYNGRYFNVGTAIGGDPLSSRMTSNAVVGGTVTPVQSAVHGEVTRIDAAAGSLAVGFDATAMNQSYTKMAWIKLTTAAYTNNMMAGLNSMHRHHLNAPAGRLSAGHGGTTTVTYVQSDSIIPVNTWAHVAVVYDINAKTMTLYVNGSPVKTATGVPAAPVASGRVEMQLSRYGNGSSTYGIDGHMIDNKLYRGALSPTQVKAVYGFELASKSAY